MKDPEEFWAGALVATIIGFGYIMVAAFIIHLLTKG